MNVNRNTLYNVLCLLCAFALLSACVGGTATQSASEREEQETTVSQDVSGVETIQLDSLETIPATNPLQSKYQNIIVASFESSEQIQTDYPNAVTDCKARILSQLKSKKAYKAITDDPSKSLSGNSVILNLKITEMRITGGAARFWGGALAGSSYMNVLLEVQDAATKKVVLEKILTTSNNAWAASFTGGSTDHSLPADFGLLIGEYVYKNVPAGS